MVLTAALLLSGGCSSDTSDQQPKLQGPNQPEIKRIGRNLGGADQGGKKAGTPRSGAPLSKP
jgi:hypothetical protein